MPSPGNLIAGATRETCEQMRKKCQPCICFLVSYPVDGFRVTLCARWNDAIIFKDQWTKGPVLRLKLRLDEVICVDRARKPSRLFKQGVRFRKTAALNRRTWAGKAPLQQCKGSGPLEPYFVFETAFAEAMRNHFAVLAR